MKKNSIKLLMLLLSVSVMVSCTKYLEEKSNKSLVTPTKLEDLQALLDDATTMNTVSTPGAMETYSDDYFLLPATYNSLASAEILLYSYVPYTYTYVNDWSKAYLTVYNSNLCLENIQKIDRTSSNSAAWDNVKGSALFFRAYYFLLLAWQHAKAYDPNTSTVDLGIVLRLGSDFNVKSVRANVNDTYEQILTDAKASIPALPDNPLHVMRPSKAAAYALLARTYLSMRMTDSAFKYADLSLHIKNTLINYNGDADINGSLTAASPFKKFNKETIFYTEMYSSFALHVPSRAKIDTVLYARYDNNDLRKTGFFKALSGYQQFKGSYAASTSTLFSGIGVDEMYLTRAECYARLNHIPEAMADLNTLLKSRWKNTVTYPVITAANTADALSIILLERRKELLMRGLRWIDIKRLNKDGANIIPTRIVNGKFFSIQPNTGIYALPLPDDIIQQTGIPQNN
jgi:hypothetical protein